MSKISTDTVHADLTKDTHHEAPVRDILEIHSDFFMAVYWYRKTHARTIAQG